MKNLFKVFIGVAIATGFMACTTQPGEEPKLKNNMDTVSYAIGLWVGKGPANVLDKKELDIDLIRLGIENAINEKDTSFSMQNLSIILRAFTQEQTAKQAEVSLQEGDDYLKKNKGKEGVKETESGLQYKVIKEGTGLSPLATDSVKVHYTGTDIKGNKFDSSLDRGQPSIFMVNKVIPGWTEGLQLMKEGAVYEFVIPSEIGYGQRGAGANIPPNATLVFEVELIEVIPSKK